MTDRLAAQIAFLKEADKLKTVERANVLLDLSRPENSAEHSWHLALWALIFEPFAGSDVRVDRAIRMLLLHDLVEIDVGDHPIHEETDWNAVATAELKAANRLFGLLPRDQAETFLSLWTEFEADQTPDARYAKMLDRCQPIFQVLCADQPVPDHVDVVVENLSSGRAAYLEQSFPEAFAHANALLEKTSPAQDRFTARLPLLIEADLLKTVNRASRLINSTRFENSAEHSWHVMLYAWVLSEHAGEAVSLDRVLRMLLLHDIVEIDAGDNPIHGHVDHAAQEAAEIKAAERLFGLLPTAQCEALMTLWSEFEAAETPDAQFGKAIDRIQTPIANLASGGGSWIDYDVTLPQMDQRVGTPIKRGAPSLWQWLRPELERFFIAHGLSV